MAEELGAAELDLRTIAMKAKEEAREQIMGSLLSLKFTTITKEKVRQLISQEVL